MNESATSTAGPFQFRLRHLLLLTLWCAGLFACAAQLGAAITLIYTLFPMWVLAFALAGGDEPLGTKRAALVFSLVFLPVGLVGVLCLLPNGLYRTRRPNPASMCVSNLKQLGIGLHAYHQHYGSFPPAYIADEKGRPMHSWRVLILSFIDNAPLYKQYRFDEPWDGPNNSKLHSIEVSTFKCPRDPGNPLTSTSYFAVVGPQTIWPGQENRKFRDFVDGAANTIMLVEVANSGIHWMEPRDLAYDDFLTAPSAGNSPRLPVSSGHRAGFNALLGDGSARTFVHSFDRQELRDLLTIDGG